MVITYYIIVVNLSLLNESISKNTLCNVYKTIYLAILPFKVNSQFVNDPESWHVEQGLVLTFLSNQFTCSEWIRLQFTRWNIKLISSKSGDNPVMPFSFNAVNRDHFFHTSLVYSAPTQFNNNFHDVILPSHNSNYSTSDCFYLRGVNEVIVSLPGMLQIIKTTVSRIFICI